MLTKLINELNIFFTSSQNNLGLLLKIIGAIWVLNLVNWVAKLNLNRFGLIPRRIRGLVGIFTGCFLHGNFNHLFFNTIPLFALGIFMLSFGVKTFYLASILIIFLESSVVWLIGRPGNHIGASSLISGYFSFILVSAYKNPSISTLLAAIVVIYYFGSIFFGIFPSEEKTSWEGHLFGFLAGIASFFIIMNNLVPKFLLILF